MKRDSNQIIEQLTKEGLIFKKFSLVNEGTYHTDDADWNYKDVPHLHYIHELVEAVPALIEDHLIASINIQKILFLSLPLTVVNYEFSRHRQVYFTSLLIFALVIETSYETISADKTRVKTTYNIGGKKWALFLFFPVIKWLLERNYRNLMSGDIPMRARRGELRSWGYGFLKPNDTHSFIETTNITRTNTVPPTNTPRPSPATFSLTTDLVVGREILWGRPDHLGLRLVNIDNVIHIFPRMCPHEGASLDKSPCTKNIIKCPWHGRGFKPLAVIPASVSDQKLETELHIIEYSNSSLTIRTR